VDVRERFRLDGQWAPLPTVESVAGAALAVFSDLHRDAPELAQRGLDTAAQWGWELTTAPRPMLTFFELTTLIALVLFKQHDVTVAVLEVGLGGRLDAVNATEPELTLITPIGYDHQAWLGNTLTAIAREKAGTLRHGRPALIAPGPAEAVEAIMEEAVRVGAQAHVITPPDEALLPPWLRGTFAVNAGLALAAAHRLGVDNTTVQQLDHYRWPGRRDRVRLGDGPLEGAWWLDGAHNPDGAQALVEAVLALAPQERPRCGVIGVMEGKDVDALGAALAPLPVTWWTTQLPPDWPSRGASWRAQPLAERLREVGLTVQASCEAVGEALMDVRRYVGHPDEPVLVCGSLYVMGAVVHQLGAPDAFFDLHQRG
ncbi:MAG: hypothetical protein AAFS10_27175, partial [Myxococcota bacterium]